MTTFNLVGLPGELHLEIVDHVSCDYDALLSLNQCSHYWRQLCLPFILAEVGFSREDDEDLQTFIVIIARPHGHLIKHLTLQYPRPVNYIEGYLDDLIWPPLNEEIWAERAIEWKICRNNLVGEIFDLLPKLSTI